MKLFIKHLFRGILRRPLQPIILTLTLAVSLTISLVALGVKNVLEEEITAHQTAAYGTADLTVTQNSSSKSRFMFADDAEQLLGEGVRATGIYELPMYRPVREETLFGVAVDFQQIGDIFPLSFSAYEAPSVRAVGSAAFLSRNYAAAAGLALGDRFTVEVLGYEKSYTVYGISEHPFLASYDCLVDISGVMELLSKDSVLVSSLGEDFRPASTIYIDLTTSLSCEDAIKRLSETEMFSGKTFTDVAERTRQESNVEILSPIVDIAVLCSSLLSVAIGFACLYILSKARQEENATFSAAGARPLHLALFQYAEMLTYLVLASALGVPSALPLLSLLVSYSGFEYTDAVLNIPDVIFAISILVLTGLLTVTFFLIMAKKRAYPTTVRLRLWHLILTLGGISALLFVSLFLLPPSLRFASSVLTVLSLLAFLCALLPLVFSSLAKVARRTGCIPLRYALKNVSGVSVLHNACRLVALTVSLLLIFSFVIVSSRGYLFIAERMLHGDYAVLGATRRVGEAIDTTEGVGDTSELYMSTAAQKDGNFVYALSLTNDDMLADELNITRLPEGNEVIISLGQSIALGLSVGDVYEVTIDNTAYSLTVAEVVRSGISFAIFDCAHFGLAYNILLVEGDGTLTNAALREELVSVLALEVGTVINFTELMHEKTDTLNTYIKCANLLLYVILFFTLLGLVDNLYESYRARRGEFSLFAYGGMSRTQIRRMKCLELLLTLGVGALAGALVALPSILAIREGLFGNGYDVIINFLRAI